jgi:hypothetical protein
LPQIAAHLILGAHDEPFLGALLASLEGVATALIVNDNAPGESPHASTLAASSFARRGQLIVDRMPFVDFAHARNVCLRRHAQANAGDWIAFVDADEVHGELAARIASRLERVPAAYDFVDAYTWHFFASFDWYTSIERRMSFFRFRPAANWNNPVHEVLTGLDGKRLALPYVYGHYGHTLAPRRYAEKGRLYSALGAPGDIVPEDRLDAIDPVHYFADIYPRLLRFTGGHPPAARATIASLAQQFAAYHALTAERAREQTPLARLRNALMQLNYEQRWRSRAFNPLARALVAP